MDGQKILEVLEIYETYFAKEKIQKQKAAFDRSPRLAADVLAHLHGMADETRRFVGEVRLDKAMVWLGFIQGALWCQGIYTLDELRNHNRPSAT